MVGTIRTRTVDTNGRREDWRHFKKRYSSLFDPTLFFLIGQKKKVSVYTILRYIRGFNFRVSDFIGALEEGIFKHKEKI